MKIQMINAPPFDITKSSEKIAGYPPLGLLYIISYVRSFHPDIKWKVSDGTLDGYKKCIDDFKNFKPDLVGISFTTPFASGAYRLIDEIKSINPSIKIVAGGAHPTALPDEALKKADIVIIGEGEKAFLKVLKDVKGKICEDYIKDIDGIPFPARDLVNMKDYFGNMLKKAKPETSIISSRGCAWSKCWFCAEMWKVCKPFYRIRSVTNLVNEIEVLQQKYNIKEFYDQAEEINVGNRAIEISNEIIKRRLDVKWKAQIRCDNVSEELMRELSKSGCWLIYLGIESGNQRTLDGIRKGITIENIRKTCELAHKYNIKTLGFFMFFNVWEDNGLCYEDLKDSLNTLDFGKKLLKDKLLDYAGWMFTTPFPFSPLWDTCMKYNLIPKDMLGKWENWNLGNNLIMKLPNVSEDDVKQMQHEVKILTTKHIIKNINLRLAFKVLKKMVIK